MVVHISDSHLGRERYVRCLEVRNQAKLSLGGFFLHLNFTSAFTCTVLLKCVLMAHQFDVIS